MEKIGVIGMGTMGSQIGLVFSGGSFQTIMVDRNQERIDWGMNNIEKLLSRRVQKGKLEQPEMDKMLSQIRPLSPSIRSRRNSSNVGNFSLTLGAVRRSLYKERSMKRGFIWLSDRRRMISFFCIPCPAMTSAFFAALSLRRICRCLFVR